MMFGTFSHVPGLLVLSGMDGSFPCWTRSPSSRGLPLGLMGTCRSPHISTELCLVLPSLCSILTQVPVPLLAVLFSFSPRAEPHFWPFSYTLVGVWLPYSLLQSRLFHFGRKEGPQRFAFSFLIQLRPCRDRVLQSKRHHV